MLHSKVTLTKFIERLRVKVECEMRHVERGESVKISLTIKKFGAVAPEGSIVVNSGVYWTTEKLGRQIISVTMTEVGEKMFNDIAERLMENYECAEMYINNETGEITIPLKTIYKPTE